MKYKFGDNILQKYKVQTKALAPRIRNMSERFDPNAIDGDDDGKVQDGTRFERPSIARQPTTPQRRSIQKISGSISISPNNSILKENIKSFDGLDLDAVEQRLKDVEETIIKKFGKITTVGDALNALKSIFGKVDLRDFGDSIGDRADIYEDLSISELYSVYGLLLTLDGVPSLKKRKAIIEHFDDGQYLEVNGATAALTKTRDGQQDFPEYGVRIKVPFHFELIKQKIIENEDDILYIDGLSTQLTKTVLQAAEREQDPQRKEQLLNMAAAVFSMTVATHESVHAIDIPNRFDILTEKIKAKNPNINTESEVFEKIAELESKYDLVEIELMKILMNNVENGSTAKAISIAIAYEKNGPEKFLENLEMHSSALAEAAKELEKRLEEFEQIYDDPNADIMARLQASLAYQQIEAMLDALQNESRQTGDVAFELKNQLEDGRPQDSYVGVMHKIVYDAGLNFLYDISPPGHPAHGKDTQKTVDEFGNVISITRDNKEIKDNLATAEFLKSFLISLISNDKFVDAAKDLGFSFENAEEMIGEPQFLKNNGADIDFSQVINSVGLDYIERLKSQAFKSFVHGRADTLLPETISEKTKWRLFNWMKQVSDYGADSHIRYFQGVNFFSPDNMISVELVAELVTSLSFGAGAARVPMPPDVRNAVIDILNWLYPGNVWKSKLPAISLEALGL